MHIGIDATNWANKRGYGRFTRELVGELSRRNSGIRYSLFFDQVPKLALPEGVAIVDAGTRRTMREVVVASKPRRSYCKAPMAEGMHSVPSTKIPPKLCHRSFGKALPGKYSRIRSVHSTRWLRCSPMLSRLNSVLPIANRIFM